MLKTKFHHFDIYLCHTNEELASTQPSHDTSYIMAGPGNSAVQYRCTQPAPSCQTCPIQDNCSINFLESTGRLLYNKHVNTFKKLA